MATGIQTGLGRTGTGIAPPGKPPSAGGVAKLMASWSGLAPKTRILTIVGALSFVVIALSTVAIVLSNRYVPLYAFNLSETDQKEVLAKLTTDNDPFTVDVGKIMVPPGKRQQLAAYLMEYGLPHRPLADPKADGGMIPPSDKEKEQIRIVELQGKLIEQMRVLNFVADAYVEIVPADDEGAMMGQARPATAQVMLQLKPGASPSREQIDAIISMVAYSVRGLDANNVKVMDDQGKILSHAIASASGDGKQAQGQDSGPSADEDLSLKTAFEKSFKDKVAPSLDKILGVDRYTLNVDCQIDYSQKKIVSTTYGDGHKLEDNSKTETFKNQPSSSASPVDKKGSKEVALGNFNTGGGPGGNDTNYVRSEVKTKNAVDTVQKEVVIPRGALQKVTASLAVDRALTDEQQKKWENWLKKSMGMDESRGDMVDVMAAAFESPAELRNLKSGLGAAGMPRHADSPLNINPTIVATAVGGGVLMLLGLVAVFLMKQQKVLTDKSSLLLSTGGSSHTTEITDLLNEKSGKAPAATTQTTTVNNRAELEKLAKEKPTRVAELLKNTWLSEKER